jgi:hypothetical protein
MGEANSGADIDRSIKPFRAVKRYPDFNHYKSVGLRAGQ